MADRPLGRPVGSRVRVALAPEPTTSGDLDRRVCRCTCTTGQDGVMTTASLPGWRYTAPQPSWASERAVARHRPLVGLWTCSRCPDGTAWPCGPAKLQLVQAYGGPTESMRRHLEDLLVRACRDLAEVPAGLLYEQLIGWAGFERERWEAWTANAGSRWRPRTQWLRLLGRGGPGRHSA